MFRFNLNTLARIFLMNFKQSLSYRDLRPPFSFFPGGLCGEKGGSIHVVVQSGRHWEISITAGLNNAGATYSEILKNLPPHTSFLAPVLAFFYFFYFS